MAFPSALETVCSLQRLKWEGGAAAFDFPPPSQLNNCLPLFLLLLPFLFLSAGSLSIYIELHSSSMPVFNFSSSCCCSLIFYCLFLDMNPNFFNLNSWKKAIFQHMSSHISHLATEILSHPVTPHAPHPPTISLRKNSGVGYKSWESRYSLQRLYQLKQQGKGRGEGGLGVFLTWRQRSGSERQRSEKKKRDNPWNLSRSGVNFQPAMCV